MKLRVFEAFAGYGSQAMALKRLKSDYPDFDFEVVGISEIDPYAIQAYRAVHGEDAPNYGDISKINWGGYCVDFDLFTYSFPCQDISSAGLQRGFAEGAGTRSSLLWECYKAITAKRPKYLLMENVKALTQKKFMPEFLRWQDALAALGYRNYWRVLNAKDYGVPQNRERVFMVSILGEHPTYSFPKGFKLERRLRHVLEADVPESYYLRPSQVTSILAHTQKHKERGNGFAHHFSDGSDCAHAITTMYGLRPMDTYIIEPQVIGFTRDEKGRVVSHHFKEVANTVTTFTGRGHTTEQYVFEPKVIQRPHGYFEGGVTDIAPCVKASAYAENNPLCEPSGRIRKFTPREGFRLMDVSDTDIDKIQAAGIAKTHQRKLAGNSIVVACLYHIFRKMFVDHRVEIAYQPTLFDFI